jgi:hypothetical protein
MGARPQEHTKKIGHDNVIGLMDFFCMVGMMDLVMGEWMQRWTINSDDTIPT